MSAHGLNEAEVAYCAAQGIDPGRYAVLKGLRTVDDFAAMREGERARAEHDRLKAAIREALDEREKG